MNNPRKGAYIFLDVDIRHYTLIIRSLYKRSNFLTLINFALKGMPKIQCGQRRALEFIEAWTSRKATKKFLRQG
jgi:hypothetical protein